MYKNLAVIPARSGSKGIKDKNIKLLNGEPLFSYTIHAAIESEVFKTVMVSTDSDKYADIARRYGAEVPFLRSQKNSGDYAGSWDTVIEVLDQYKRNGATFDTVCLLQPTSPLRTASDIMSAYDFFHRISADAVTSVCEFEYPMENIMDLAEDMSMNEYRKRGVDLPRQLYRKRYRLNGAIYIRKVTYESNKIILECKNEYAYVMDRRQSIDIDESDDFDYAEYIMKRNRIVLGND